MRILATCTDLLSMVFTENNDDLVGATGGEPPMSLGQPTHTLHDANEPIIPRSQDLIEGSEKAHTKVRKIAAGPAAPTYKGIVEKFWCGHDTPCFTFIHCTCMYRISRNKSTLCNSVSLS